MQRWADAAFEQERLLGTVRHNPIFRDYVEGFQQSAYDDDFPEGMMLKLHEHLLQEADPMYVSAEVTDIWDHARESFQPEVMHAWDLPCPVSFSLLPRPMIVTDVDGNKIAFRAISWIPAGSGDVEWTDKEPQGVWYTLWSSIDDYDDFNRHVVEMPERESWEALGQWAILFSGFLPFGALEDYEAMVANNPDAEQEIHLRRRTWLLLQSFWRLSRQIVPVKEALPRQLRRQRKRFYRTEDVTVITLRRQRSPHDFDHGEGEVEWKYQWVVRGHWRNQYYSTLGEVGDPSAYRQIWIMPFMKGPEDKPIKPVKRAFEFTR